MDPSDTSESECLMINHNQQHRFDETSPLTHDSESPMKSLSNDEFSEETAEDVFKRRQESGLLCTIIPFVGLIQDISRKSSFYLSDFRDGFSSQGFGTWIYLYFIIITQIVGYGNILSWITNNNIGVNQVILSGTIFGIGYSFFAGQPLVVLGPPGIFLIFESIIFSQCSNLGLDYMEIRLWIGLWICIFLIIFVMFNASAFASCITRLTQETYATMLCIIYIIESCMRIYFEITNPNVKKRVEGIMDGNLTDTLIYSDDTPWDFSSNYQSEEAKHNSNKIKWIYIMSTIIFVGTLLIPFLLKWFRHIVQIPVMIRLILSDFAVTISIALMILLDCSMGIETSKFGEWNKIELSWPNWNWVIKPFRHNPWWTIFAAAVPGFYLTIVIFLEQTIASTYVNRKENQLKKGCGYHLDIFILAILIGICSFFGLPWFIASIIPSIANVRSLSLETLTIVRGDKPKFVGVREQRLSNFLIYVAVGLTLFMIESLQFIPITVVYGVVVYMAVSCLINIKFMERLVFLFTPNIFASSSKYGPYVSGVKVRLFTLIQIFLYILLWIIKSHMFTSTLFPMMLLVLILIRKVLDLVFTQKELAVLDDLVPPTCCERRQQ